MIIMIHGGPYARDVWGYDSEIQFFTSLGYSVMQINFRGSTGYGKEYSINKHADICKYSLDDVKDGIDWAVRMKLVKPGKIAIYGASFGGYVSLASAAFYPDLFECAIGYAGVYDWIVEFEADMNNSEKWFEDFGPMFLDLEKDRPKYIKCSPINNVDNIKIPVYLIHGKSDHTVNKSQTSNMAAKLSKAGNEPKVDYFSWGVHGHANENHRIEFYKDLAKFLETNMK